MQPGTNRNAHKSCYSLGSRMGCHKFFCETCGQESDVPALPTCGCYGTTIGGICDARGCRSISKMSDAMAEIEKHDIIVRRIIVSSLDFLEDQHDINDDGITLFGAKIISPGGILVWDEELVTPDSLACV